MFLFQLSGGTNLRRVRVVLLSGQHLDVGCEPNNTNKMLFDAVISHLGVSEQFLFGLSFIHGKAVLLILLHTIFLIYIFIFNICLCVYSLLCQQNRSKYWILHMFSEGEHFFTDPEAKLYKIAPPQWKDPPKGQLPSPFTLYFRVKFYPENILGVQ